MAALDRNGDGKLQQEEIDMAVVVLRRMDANKDGTVSGDEIKAPARRPGMASGQGNRPGQPGGQRRFPTFADMDKNDDGKISKEETPERMRARFDQMDGNGDGFLDKNEQAQIIKRFRERLQGGEGRRPGQRQGGRRGENGEDSSGGEAPKRPAPIE